MGICKCCLCVWYMATLLFALSCLVFLFIFLPQELKFTVSDASLTSFDYNSTGNNTLFYAMALNVTIRNPNKKVGVYFNRIQTLSHYAKKQFSMVTLTSPPFYLGHKNTTVVTAAIQGQQLLLFKKKDVDKYNTETSAGIYSVEVELANWVKERFGKYKTPYGKSDKICCKLKVPLLRSSTIINGTASGAAQFKPTRCETEILFYK